jgi:hypothetical protein
MKKLVINKDHSVDGFMLLRDREMYDIEQSHGNHYSLQRCYS